MKTIALVAKPQKPEAAALAQQMRERYPQLEWLVEAHFGAQLGWPWVSNEMLTTQAELIIVLGGDGTLIHAARLLKGRPVPILGVNLGSLGFMTEVPVADAFHHLDSVLASKARIDSRMKLTCRLFRDEKLVLSDEVLNDVVINKSTLARITDHQTFLDGSFMATFKADGVIFATPTGSTAYSLSAGGPVVHPSIDCVVVTPICPHALTQRPIVVPGDQTLTLTLSGAVTDVYVTFDGQEGHLLKKGDRLEVQKSPNRVYLVRNESLDYLAVLRQKLHWGAR